MGIYTNKGVECKFCLKHLLARKACPCTKEAYIKTNGIHVDDAVNPFHGATVFGSTGRYTTNPTLIDTHVENVASYSTIPVLYGNMNDRGTKLILNDIHVEDVASHSHNLAVYGTMNKYSTNLTPNGIHVENVASFSNHASNLGQHE